VEGHRGRWLVSAAGLRLLYSYQGIGFGELRLFEAVGLHHIFYHSSARQDTRMHYYLCEQQYINRVGASVFILRVEVG